MIPPHAARIWSDADEIHIQLPTITGGEGHIVSLPHTTDGMVRVLRIIRERTPQSTIGTVGSPTKYQLEQEANRLIKSSGKSPRRPIEATAEQRESTAAILRELGII